MSSDRLVADASAKFASIDRQFAEMQIARENAKRELEEAKKLQETQEKHKRIISKVESIIRLLQLSRNELNFGKVEKFLNTICSSNGKFDELMKEIEDTLLDS
jgi:hypothetical protein